MVFLYLGSIAILRVRPLLQLLGTAVLLIKGELIERFVNRCESAQQILVQHGQSCATLKSSIERQLEENRVYVYAINKIETKVGHVDLSPGRGFITGPKHSYPLKVRYW